MIIYHGHPSPNSIEACREAAPSHTHGAEWSPAKMTPHDWPYIVDNGAFAAFKHDKPWNQDEFLATVSEVEKMPREPDFVVLPDVVASPQATYDRSEIWADWIDYSTAMAVQDGMDPEEAVVFADRIGAETIFVGGTVDWKRRVAEDFVTAAHDHGLRCHIGRPNDLTWAKNTGADSVDTTTIVQDENWGKLRTLEQQSTLRRAQS